MTIPFTGYKAKDKTPYEVAVGERHRQVLQALSYYPNSGLSDAELTFKIRMQNAGARRCELRDIGAVIQLGKRNGSSVKTWRLSERGYELLRRMNADNKARTVAEPYEATA